jgi:hypothetical protein
VDEYIVYGDNVLAVPADRNCFQGTPPNPYWKDIVAVDAYYQGCWGIKPFRSSANSLMYSLSEPSFNNASIFTLHRSLNTYIKKYIDPNADAVIDFFDIDKLTTLYDTTNTSIADHNLNQKVDIFDISSIYHQFSSDFRLTF